MFLFRGKFVELLGYGGPFLLAIPQFNGYEYYGGFVFVSQAE